MKEKKIGLLYVSLHNQLKKNVGENHAICRKKFFEILGKHYLIPKNLRDVVIKEMEKRCLVKIESKNSILVLHCDVDMEKDIYNLYKEVGILKD